MPFNRIDPVKMPEPPQVELPPRAALWRLYLSGRRGPEKHLGFVVAERKSMRWARSCPTLAMDIMEVSSLDDAV